MGDEATERITILLQAKDAEFKRAMEKNNSVIARATKQWEQNTSRATKSIDRDLKSAASSAATFGKNFLTGLAVGGAAALFAGMTTGLRDVVGSIADMVDAADKIGITTVRFQELQYAMEQDGVSADDFSSSMLKFSKNIGDAARGTGTFKDVLATNGIALRDMQGNVRPTSDLLSDFADMISRVPDEATRMSLITEAFGRGSDAMALALARGKAGLEDGTKAAHEAGAVMDEETTAAAARLDDKFVKLTATVRTFFMASAIGWAAMLEDGLAAAKAIKDAFSVTDDAEAATDGLLQSALQLRNALAGEVPALLDNESLAASGMIISDMSDKVDQLIVNFQSGKISQEEFTTALEANRAEAVQFLGALQDINGVDFSSVMAVLGNLGGVIDALAQKAAIAAAGISSLAGHGGGNVGASASGSGTINLRKHGGGGGGGSRGGGGGSSNNDAEQWFKQTRTEAEKYAADLAELDKLLADGSVTQDTYARSLDLIHQKYDLAGDAGKFMQNTATDLQDAFLDAALTGENAFGRIADAIKRAALEAALFGNGPLAGLFGGGKGLLGGLLGGVVGGASASSASASVASRAIASAPMARAAASKAGVSGTGNGTMNINVNVTGARGDKEIEALVRSGVKQGIAGYDKHVLPSRVRSIAADPRRRN